MDKTTEKIQITPYQAWQNIDTYSGIVSSHDYDIDELEVLRACAEAVETYDGEYSRAITAGYAFRNGFAIAYSLAFEERADSERKYCEMLIRLQKENCRLVAELRKVKDNDQRRSNGKSHKEKMHGLFLWKQKRSRALPGV